MPHPADVAAALAVAAGDVQVAEQMLLDDEQRASPDDEATDWARPAVPPSGPVILPDEIVSMARREGVSPEVVHRQIEAGLREVVA